MRRIPSEQPQWLGWQMSCLGANPPLGTGQNTYDYPAVLNIINLEALRVNE